MVNTDNKATICSFANGVVKCGCILACSGVLGGLMLVAAPVTLPIFLVRSHKYKKYLQDAVNALDENERKFFYTTLGVPMDKKITFAHIFNFKESIKKHEGLNRQIYNLVHPVFSKSRLTNSCPPEEEVKKSIVDLAKELYRQSKLSTEEYSKEVSDMNHAMVQSIYNKYVVNAP